jgi:hypothetical protein
MVLCEDGIISGEFLEKKGLLRAALKKEEELARKVPGYEVDVQLDNQLTDILYDSMRKIRSSDPYINGLSILSEV